jgi:hypothetical protein
MKQSKFSLADVLTLLTSLIFGFVCFLGANFYTLGNMSKSMMLSLIITVVLFSTVFAAKRLKLTSINFKTRFLCEIALLIFFTILFVFFTFMPFSHYFTVSDKSSDIVNKLQSNITQAEKMFSEYESYSENRKILYKRRLKTVVIAKHTLSTEYLNYGFIYGIEDEIQINKKMENINANLYPTNYSDLQTKRGIKEVASSWLFEAKNTAKNWKPIGIPNVVVEVDIKSEQWLSSLIENSKTREKGEQAEDFHYPLTYDQVKQDITTLGKPNMTSLFLGLLMWVLMMLSWFVTKRHTRFPGFKPLFSTSHKSINEL